MNGLGNEGGISRLRFIDLSNKVRLKRRRLNNRNKFKIHYNPSLDPLMEKIGLVADVGGTNIRLATIEINTGSIGNIHTYLCADYPSIADVIEDYKLQVTAEVQYGCIAVACPVDDDIIDLTNNNWQFSVSELKKQFGFRALHLINDYTAIAMAIPKLTANQTAKIGRGEPIKEKPIAVCGPGTGLGVALLKKHRGDWVCLDGEGGHVDFAPHGDLEDHMLRRLRNNYSHVSAERFLTGPGLVNIFHCVKNYYEELPEEIEPHEVTQRALDGTDQRCQEALDVFCRLLGSFAGNLALTIWATGGVYIAGGIAPKIVDYIKSSNFRAKFEAKGRFAEALQKIPTYIIMESQPGIIGAGSYLTQMEKRV